ncbi:hypothetical protein [Pedobacter cryoconitis]|uniref:hypothetical protein n=1 Tax=Pedobacter cryoconitis TaxID=188932 RepID=UPI001620279D|nr:hypothetical protein [Pedobacter cryoconitis]
MSLITQVSHFFQKIYWERKLDWDNAFSQSNGDTVAVFVPVELDARITLVDGGLPGARLDNLLYLRLMTTSKAFEGSKAEMISMIPDQIWEKGKKFSGHMFIENWFVPNISVVSRTKNSTIPTNINPKKAGDKVVNGFMDCYTATETACVGVGGGETCVTNTTTVCVGGGGGNPGGGGGYGGGGTGGGGGDAGTPGAAGGSGGNNGNPNNPTATWSLDLTLFNYPPGEKISDIKKYLQCIDSQKAATITIYVDQPENNSTDTWSGNPADPEVGHTFVTIQQGDTKRTFGYYPDKPVNPLLKPSSSSTLIMDEGHKYNVKISIPVEPAQLQNVLNTSVNYKGTYNLNSYNCTDFGLSIIRASGLNMESNEGNWPGGGGHNPGNFGQEVRNSKFPGNVTKDTVPGNAPLNSGNCNK